MSRYLIPKAYCQETNQTVKSQNFTRRFELHERRQALLEAEHIAQQMQKKTGRVWSPRVEEYQLIDQLNRI